MKHFVLLVTLIASTGCAHFLRDSKDCAIEAGKDVEIDLMPAVRHVLEIPNPVTVEIEMAKLVLKYGHSFVTCMVTKIASEADHMMKASPTADNSVPLLVKTNARNWLATHP